MSDPWGPHPRTELISSRSGVSVSRARRMTYRADCDPLWPMEALRFQRLGHRDVPHAEWSWEDADHRAQEPTIINHRCRRRRAWVNLCPPVRRTGDSPRAVSPALRLRAILPNQSIAESVAEAFGTSTAARIAASTARNSSTSSSTPSKANVDSLPSTRTAWAHFTILPGQARADSDAASRQQWHLHLHTQHVG